MEKKLSWIGYYAGAVLATIIYCAISLPLGNKVQFLTVLFTLSFLMMNFGHWFGGICEFRGGIIAKIWADVAAIVVTILTFVPATYFVYKAQYDEYDINMSLFFAIIGAIGIVSIAIQILDLIVYLFKIWHKYRVWGKR